MRLKRTITLMLLIFANILLLAHSVLPHSHHDGVVCFLQGHHQNMELCCCGHVEHDHHHSKAEDCNLKSIILRQQDDIHEEIVPCTDCLLLVYGLYSLNEFYLQAPQFGKFFRQKPYLESYTPPFVGSVKSLRAPPFSYSIV